ncbi:hypothetical protein D9Q98_004320 [Chlorella vulgaris]|uniref:Uncharacterized protein n=1 Tax=Chlorella vulgaris TaxID=3077 RepID=A0A9D4TPN3_CHLVU|nr:hypothetical protein D9Q98_004320 [Chlorella vulgaris]
MGQAVEPRKQWQHALAGTVAGLCTGVALHPLDLLKTRMQVQDGAGLLPAYRGTVDAVRQIVRQEGWRALYSGLTPALVGSGVAWGAYFFAYNRAKQRYQRASKQARLGPGMHLVSAAEAGVLVCFLTNPIWVVKTRLQLQRRTLQQAAAAAAAGAAGSGGAAAAGAAAAGAAVAGSGTARLLAGFPGAGGLGGGACALEYRGFLHAFVQIARCEGLPGLYKGLLPSLLLVSHGAIQFAVYEELKVAALGFSIGSLAPFTRSLDSGTSSSSSSSGGGKKGAAGQARELSHAEITACGALSKLVASTATYPTQVVRSRLQQRMDARALQYTGVVDVVRKTMQREGLGAFYKGIAPNLVRVMPQSALTFLVFESVMRLLQRPPQQPAQAAAAAVGAAR